MSRVAKANETLTRPRALAELGVYGLKETGGLLYEEFDPGLRGKRGIRLYDEMRHNDPVIGAVLNAIELVLRGVSWHCRPLAESKEARGQADFVISCMGDMSHSWADLITEALTFLSFGWAYMEIVYKLRRGPSADPVSRFGDGKLGWRKIALRGHETLVRWLLDEHGGIRGMVQAGPPSYRETPVPIEKAILFRTKREKNNPEGYSLLRNAVRPYVAKKGLEEIETIGAERDLTGLPIVWLPSNADDEDFNTARDIVERIKVDDQAGLVLQRFGPEDYQNWGFELVGSPGSKAIDVDKALNRYAGEISMVFLAQFLRLGLQRVGSYALAREQKDLFHLSLSSILDNMRETMNRFLLPPLLRLNGEDVLVSLEHDPIGQADLEAVAGFLARLAPAGFVTPDRTLEEALRGMADLPSLPEEKSEAAKAVEGAEPLAESGVPEGTVAEVERSIEGFVRRYLAAQGREGADNLDALEMELRT